MRALAVITRTPSSGVGKTRLRDHLPDTAVDLLVDAMVRDTLAWARRIDAVLVVCHAGDAGPLRAIAPDARFVAQPDGDFGSRLRATVDAGFATGATHVVLIGMDSPTLPTAYVEACFAGLRDRDDATIVPAYDGGWIALGLRRPLGHALDGIAWSMPTTLDATIGALNRAGFSVVSQPPWYDVDDAESLQQVARDVAAPECRAHAPLTARVLDRVMTRAPRP